ncbi:MAG TPA: tRNA pseudouridine(38-40) synthase TruA [Clostridia bacterium]|nr:tRNA pseudouridine(38-40) synthase TruA [Clostridia bacterium]
MRVRLVIQYAGANYVGWQVQPNGVSVQALIEAELYKLTGAHVTLHASGRTDSGVNARAQVAHFDTPALIPAEKYAYALNTGLPRDIRVMYSGEAEGFHARFDVVKKHYRYCVENRPHASAFYRDTALHVHAPLDIALLNEAAKGALGTHDFSAFKAAGTKTENAVRTIYKSEWTEQGRQLCYDVAGSGFLYNMVRILVGTMLRVGMGRSDKDSVKKALLSGKRSDAGPTAPAHGLTLYRVQYEGFDTEDYVC